MEVMERIFFIFSLYYAMSFFLELYQWLIVSPFDYYILYDKEYFE